MFLVMSLNCHKWQVLLCDKISIYLHVEFSLLMYNRLVAVIGPSGPGKDALIAGAGKILANNPAYW